MLCPFCLEQIVIEDITEPFCPTCTNQVPPRYIRTHDQFPLAVTNAIGFRQHGKTVYFASLFYALKKLPLAEHWSNYYMFCHNDHSLDIVNENIKSLTDGYLPPATLKNFPTPTILGMKGIPYFSDHTLLCYDTAGESFERGTEIEQFAYFVKRAHTALFLISLDDLEDEAGEMDNLLNKYILGMDLMGSETRFQNLIVVYTKADLLLNSYLRAWPEVVDYIRSDSVMHLVKEKNYVKKMHAISKKLAAFTKQELRAFEFMNAARDNFKSVEFSIISALGARPQGDELSQQIVPRRVLDPMFWIMEKSLSRWAQFKRKWDWNLNLNLTSLFK